MVLGKFIFSINDSLKSNFDKIYPKTFFFYLLLDKIYIYCTHLCISYYCAYSWLWVHADSSWASRSQTTQCCPCTLNFSSEKYPELNKFLQAVCRLQIDAVVLGGTDKNAPKQAQTHRARDKESVHTGLHIEYCNRDTLIVIQDQTSQAQGCNCNENAGRRQKKK